jgi:hypothetical protein
MTDTDALLAKVRDHVNDQHTLRWEPGCPVCDAWAARIRAESERPVILALPTNQDLTH